MSKFKLYAIIAGVVLFFGMGATIKILIARDKAQKSDIARLESNWVNEIANKQKVVNLLVKEKELTRAQRKAVDSLAKELKIKPKNIERVIYIDVITKDTVKMPVPVYITAPNEYLLKDSSKCFKYASKLILKDNVIKAERQYFEYNNQTTEVFYKIRPYKFLFIHFGKWQYKQQISSTCGDVQEKSIVFLAK